MLIALVLLTVVQKKVVLLSTMALALQVEGWANKSKKERRKKKKKTKKKKKIKKEKRED